MRNHFFMENFRFSSLFWLIIMIFVMIIIFLLMLMSIYLIWIFLNIVDLLLYFMLLFFLVNFWFLKIIILDFLLLYLLFLLNFNFHFLFLMVIFNFSLFLLFIFKHPFIFFWCFNFLLCCILLRRLERIRSLHVCSVKSTIIMAIKNFVLLEWNWCCDFFRGSLRTFFFFHLLLMLFIWIIHIDLQFKDILCLIWLQRSS